jgi:hypothetical protein
MKNIMKAILKPAVIATTLIALTHSASATVLPEDYKPFHRMIGSYNAQLITGDDKFINCQALVYDRNKDSGYSDEGGFKGRDLIEYRVRTNSAWEKYPYMIITDDDFDGIADREFLDHDRDGTIDEVNDINCLNLEMDRFDKTYRTIEWTIFKADR